MKRRNILKIFVAALLAVTLVISLGAGTSIAKKTDAKKTVKTDYSKYSNTKTGFGLGLNKEHKKPGYSHAPGVKNLKDFYAYYCDEKAAKNGDKVAYLTFDCGYENGYTKTILKTLKKNKVKAIFFVTEPYVKEHPELVKQMKKEGHLVGNHTCTHPQLPTRSVESIRKEVNQCAKTMKKLTGYEMDKYIRPPEGCYSARVLKVLSDMGYATIFWSLAYYDYDPAHQPGKTAVVNKFKTYYHPGLMPLIHIVSKSNAEALPEVISFLKSKKYRFGEVSDFALRPGEKEEREAAAKAAKEKEKKKKAAKKAAKGAADEAAQAIAAPTEQPTATPIQ